MLASPLVDIFLHKSSKNYYLSAIFKPSYIIYNPIKSYNLIHCNFIHCFLSILFIVNVYNFNRHLIFPLISRILLFYTIQKP